MFWSLEDEKSSTGFWIDKIDQEVDVSITVVALDLDGLFEFFDWVLCLHLIKEIH
jgi:ABC-type Mn2+/Zn2+ transport system ATPase subunit